MRHSKEMRDAGKDPDEMVIHGLIRDTHTHKTSPKPTQNVVEETALETKRNTNTEPHEASPTDRQTKRY